MYCKNLYLFFIIAYLNSVSVRSSYRYGGLNYGSAVDGGADDTVSPASGDGSRSDGRSVASVVAGSGGGNGQQSGEDDLEIIVIAQLIMRCAKSK